MGVTSLIFFRHRRCKLWLPKLILLAFSLHWPGHSKNGTCPWSETWEPMWSVFAQQLARTAVAPGH
jgi:hypothetical protein